MSNVNNRGNGNGGRNRKRARSGNQPRTQPAQKKQKRPRGRGGGRSAANSASGGNAAFSNPQLHFAPVAIGAKMSKTKPMFERSADQQRIIHREKIAKIVSGGTGVFAILKTIALNPGVAASFPWLANEAAGYETYKFNRLRFVWVPSIGSAVAGNVIMGPDYDAADAAPVGEAALSSYTDSDEERIWCPLAVECSPSELNDMKRRYVRTGALATGLDIKTYDAGNFFVAVTDDAAAQTGKLWVEYDVTLFNPQVPPGGFFSTGALFSNDAGLAAATPFAAVEASGAPVLSAATNVVTVTGAVIGQEYFLSTTFAGTGITSCILAVTSGATAITGPLQGYSAGATAGHTSVTVTATAETMSFTYTMTATTITASRTVCTVLAPAPGF